MAENLGGVAGPSSITPSVMPKHQRTQEVLAAELDAWWESLDLGQRMTVYATADAHAPVRTEVGARGRTE